MGKRRRLVDDRQLSLDALFAAPEAARDEQVRQAREDALGEDGPGALSGDRGSRSVLFGVGRAGRGRDPGARAAPGGPGPAGRGVPGEGGAAEHGAPAGRGGGAERAGVDHAPGGGERDAGDGRPGADAARDAPSALRGRRDGVAFRPRSQDDLAPSGARARVTANLAALEVLRALQAEERAATTAEQRVLARW